MRTAKTKIASFMMVVITTDWQLIRVIDKDDLVLKIEPVEVLLRVRKERDFLDQDLAEILRFGRIGKI